MNVNWIVLSKPVSIGCYAIVIFCCNVVAANAAVVQNNSGLVQQSTPVSESANSNAAPQSTDPPKGFLNWPLKTNGGMQFWTDFRNVSDWRIQQNSETGHYRLIDSTAIRRVWGNYAHCEQRLNQRIADGTVCPANGPVVILLHGLIRTSNSMHTMQRHLRGQGYHTVNFCYASSRQGTQQHAQALRSVVAGLGSGVTDIYFVAHSLGNIVIRRYLYETTNASTGVQGDPRIRRIVMLGPPNQGSKAARILKNSLIFRSLAGASGIELASHWNAVAAELATPGVPFGIIAGGQQGDATGNPWIDGKDDYTVSVQEARLVGASDFLVRPLLHGTMMNQPLVLEATVRFFRHGYFLTLAEQTPLTAQPSASPQRNDP